MRVDINIKRYYFKILKFLRDYGMILQNLDVVSEKIAQMVFFVPYFC